MKTRYCLSLCTRRDDANLGHLVRIRSDVGCDAEQHFDMFPNLLWDLVQHCWTDAAQLQSRDMERMEQDREEEDETSH